MFTDGRNMSMMISIGACSRSVLWVVDFDCHLGDENANENIDKRICVGKSGPNMAPVGSPSKNPTIRQVICAQVVLPKQLCSPFCCVLSHQFPLGKAC